MNNEEEKRGARILQGFSHGVGKSLLEVKRELGVIGDCEVGMVYAP